MRMNSNHHNYPLVFVHGFMQQGSEWDNIIDWFNNRVYCAAPTLSPQSPAEASLEALANQVVEAARYAMQQTLAPAVVLVGYSLGGRVALEVARTHPHLLAALVLESAGLGPEDEQQRESMAARSTNMATRLRTDGLSDFVHWWEGLSLFASQQELDDSLCATIRKNRLACNPESMALLLEHAGAETMPLASDARALLASLCCPVCYVAGTRDEKYASLTTTLPQSVDVRLFDAGHNVHLERPGSFVQVLVNTLDALG